MSRPNRDELSPLLFLERSALVYGDREGVIDGGRRFTYAGFADRVARLAGALAERGIERGERVAVLAHNSCEALEANFGVTGAGAVLCALNFRLSAREIREILDHSASRLVIVSPELRPLLDGVDRPVIEIGGEYDAWLAASVPLRDLSPRSEEEPFAVNYTSGTTGRPKGVVYTHRGAYLTGFAQALEMELTADSRYLWTLPMFHCNGWGFPWAVTCVGARHIAIPRPDPEVIWDELERGVTHLCCAPTVLVAAVAHPSARHPGHAWRVVTGGAPPSPTLIERCEALGARIVHMYGLTETYGPAAVCAWRSEWDADEPSARARRRARQGVPTVKAGRIRVVDGDGRDVPADGQTMGEVLIAGNGVMAGYLDDDHATGDAFRSGMFHSGDAAVVHPDGYIELRDRFKDVIISGGENISTIEVEQVLVRHPAVLEAAVVAIPDERWGERPKAFVTFADGQTAEEAELIAFCRGELAHFKCPDRIEAVDDLPKTSTGKIQKFVLREREWAGRASRVN